MSGIQRKCNYRIRIIFGNQPAVNAYVDSFSPPEFTKEIGSYKNQRFGHMNPEGNASFGPASFTVAFPFDEEWPVNTTSQLIHALYDADKSLYPNFNIEVSFIEIMDGTEKETYIMMLEDCKLAGIKYDDIGTEVEELMKATITVQPKHMGRPTGVEML